MRFPCSYLGMHKSPKSNTGPRNLYLPYSRILCQIGSGRNTYGTPLKANPSLDHFVVGMGIAPDLQMNFPSPVRLGIKQSYFRQRLNAHAHIASSVQRPSRKPNCDDQSASSTPASTNLCLIIDISSLWQTDSRQIGL